MKFGFRDVCLEHETGERHPEHPDRLRAIRRALARVHGAEYVAGAPASRTELLAVHDADYVDRVEAFCGEGGGSWDPDTVAVEATWRAALASAGLARWAALSALEGTAGRETPFALGRPPGHHATEDEAMGFCFFNNVAVATAAALERVERVAIVDWDVHHGNGTQAIFYDREDVLYVSVHERDLFPGTGAVAETGEGDAAGTTVNVPLPGGAGDSAVLAVAEEIVAPIVDRYEPDLVLVSAGFDAHVRDPISRLRVTSEGYGLLADRVRAVARRSDAALGFVLEGGYGLEALAESVRTVHEIIHGRDPAEIDEAVDERVREVIDAVRETHGLGSR